MRFYIGAPIDTSKPEHPPAAQFQELVDVISEAFPINSVIYHPLSAFQNAEFVNAQDDLLFVSRINNTALRLADIGVFVWNGSPSFGLPLEIEECCRLNKRFFVWNKTGKRLGLYLRARINKCGFEARSKAELINKLMEKDV